MAKTLLEIVQQASGELGLGVPNAAASSTAQDVVQMVYLANALGDEGPGQAQAERIRLQRCTIGNPGAHAVPAGQAGPMVNQELCVGMKHGSGLWPE
jgi:hypothetical protein